MKRKLVITVQSVGAKELKSLEVGKINIFEKKLKEFKEWLYNNKNQPARDIVKLLNVKLVGYYRYFGVTFNIY